MNDCETLANIISMTAKSKKVAVSKMLLDCGLGKNTIVHLRSGSAMGFDTLAKIATYLGVSVDYLLGNEKQPTQMGELSEDEVALLDAFRALNQEGQEKLVDYASDLVALGKYKKCNSAELGA